MKKIIVASENPVKIQATLEGFKKMFPSEEFEIKGISVNPGVKDQPMTDEETRQGAENRASLTMKQYPEADFCVGIEGGVEERSGELGTFAWAVVKSKKRMGKGKTATFYLPENVAKLIHQGKELGDAMDEIFGRSNSKQKEGAIGILTGGVIDRKALYTPAVVNALIPFKRKNLFR